MGDDMSTVYYDNINGFSQLKMENSRLYGRLNSGEWTEIETGGEPGEPGADGLSAYVYIAWCSDPSTGANFSLTTPADYIAFLSTNTQLASPQFSQFPHWAKYIGEDGTNGTSSYVYYAYASDADGTNFSLSPADGLNYQAILVTHTALVSPSLADFAGLFYQYKTDLSAYLPLSGGAMTGTQISRSVTNSNLLIRGGTAYTTGATLALYGNTFSGSFLGSFRVIAHDGTNTKELVGLPSGALTWDGKNIVRTVNNVSANAAGDVTITSVSGNAGTATKLQTARTITLAGDLSGSTTFDGSGNVSITATVKDDSHNHVISNVDGLQSALDGKAASSHTHSYLPLSGGKMTSITAMTRNVDNSYLSIFGGTTTGKGAQIDLCGSDHSTMPSTFIIHARNSSTDNLLKGSINGSLTWCGKDISLGYPKYSAGVALGSVSTYTATGDGWIFAYTRRNDAYWNLRVGGVKIFVTGGSGYDAGSCLIPVKKGDVIKTYAGHDETTTAYAVTMVFYTNR